MTDYLITGFIMAFLMWGYSTMWGRFSWFDTLVLFPLCMFLWPLLMMSMLCGIVFDKFRNRRGDHDA